MSNVTPKIKELAEQAGITTNLDTDFYEKDMTKWVDYFSEKFCCHSICYYSNTCHNSVIYLQTNFLYAKP